MPILNEYPLIKSCEQFLSKIECEEIINLSKDLLVPGQVIGPYGLNSIMSEQRSASTVYFKDNKELPLRDTIFNRVSEYTGFNKNRFEKITITNYKVGQEFKTHQDYFIDLPNEEYKKSNVERCKYGGNRLSTIILYLNDVDKGGETFFPWLDIKVTPEQGKLLQFNYDYENPDLNIRTQHASMPVLNGEKWIITIWVREYSMSEESPNYKSFTEETNIYSKINDLEFSLVCGPEEDIRELNIKLPGNTDPMNTILVGFTGGMDSSLLLYVLGALNNSQPIPYHIQPVCVTGTLCESELKINEDYINAKYMSELIQSKVGGNIKNLEFISSTPKSKREDQVKDGLLRYFTGRKEFHSLTFRKQIYVYTGANEYPNDSSRWENIGRKREKSKSAIWAQPLFNLQKYHILDALIKLELFDILEKTQKCSIKHDDLLSECVSFACNERRWSFTKINKHELGNKYFIKKETKNE